MGTDLALYKDGLHIATLGRAYNYESKESTEDLASYAFYNMPLDPDERKSFLSDLMDMAWRAGASDTVRLMCDYDVETRGE